MFWIILLCHFIADYPLQTNAMVVAKKHMAGLIMHVVMHCMTMLVVLCGILSIDTSVGISLSLIMSGFHLIIDYWKNVLSKLRPEWVIKAYVQDQVLHYLSILLVCYLSQKFGWTSFLEVTNSMIIYAIGFVLVTHFWFITERIFSYKNASYDQWMADTMWSRMMSRSILYSTVIVGVNAWVLALIVGAVVVGWNDLECTFRKQTIAKDFFGVSLLIVVTLWLIST
jgi:hypothetical protein